MSGVRTRWAAIGAAIAVTLGGGAFGVVRATVSSGDRTAYFPITPTRVLDTRNTTEVTNSTLRLTVEGSIAVVGESSTRTVVPTDASAVAINLTVTGGRKNGNYGYVTAFPCTSDADPVPNASSLNFENGVDIANALNVTTSSNGSICLYVYGTADLIVDIAGYYADHNHDDRYYTKAQTDTALSEKADSTDLYQPVIPTAPRTLDSVGDVGQFTAIAIGTNGYPIISYRDNTNGDLKVAACTNPTCTNSTITTLDSGGDVGWYPSIAIGTNGNPIISYNDNTNDDLKVVACTNPTCTTSTITPLDSFGNVGMYTSIAIGTNGYPIISYQDVANGDLKVAACTNSTCSTASIYTLDNNGVVGMYTSIAIGTSGNPIISHYDLTNGNLKVAACRNSTCNQVANTASIYTLDSGGDVGSYPSIAIGTNGNPVISYFDNTIGDLKVAVCDTATCSTSTNRSVDNAGGGPLWFTSITIGTNGNPIISYYNGTITALMMATCINPTCTGYTITTLDNTADVGWYTSITLDTNGNPIISYYDYTAGNLKVASAWWLAGGN